MELSDLEWFENGPDFMYGVDKEGKVYGLRNNGELRLIPGKSADLSWNYASLDEVKQYIERRKAVAA
jgi:hypothetical protein